LTDSIDDLARRCEELGQPELGAALVRLDGDAQRRLADEVAALDLPLVAKLVDRFLGAADEEHTLGEVAPPNAVTLPRGPADEARDAAARERGERHLRDGKVALVLLAGGQGSRLGFEGPKGDYPFAPVSGRTLFDFFAAKVAALRARYGAALPWFIMTSPVNDRETREIFAATDHFGLEPESVHFMVQGTLPAVDATTGRVLLEAPDRIALSPDGHGGLLSTLRRSGALDTMAGMGVETIFTFQVDNPLTRIARPELIGHHLLAGAEMSNVAVRKLAPEEKMGVIATVDGRTGVIEYSDLPDEMAARRDASGGLWLWAGSIAVHCLQRDFVERLTEGGLALPFHRAVKKVSHVDDRGKAVTPAEPNAIKFETFLFDALPLAEASVTLEAAREDEFSPIKNAEGADSPETARVHLNRMYARWLAAAGVAVPTDSAGEPVDLEIDPRLALDAEELAARLPHGLSISGPTALGPQAARAG
jgi:UDP-N-acetylglucosamine/UDP-N-acetylgalactosamine diphosphorylase